MDWHDVTNYSFAQIEGMIKDHVAGKKTLSEICLEYRIEKEDFYRIKKAYYHAVRLNQLKKVAWATASAAEKFASDMNLENVQPYVYHVLNSSAINEYILPKSRVLDIGCGHGQLSIFLADKGHSVVSMDYSQDMLDILNRNKNSRDIETRQGDAYAIPAQNAEFDAITARMFIMHFPTWKEIIVEMARCCRIGGRIVFNHSSADNRVFSEKYTSNPFEKVYSSDIETQKGYTSEFYAAELKELCDGNGLKILALRPINVLFGNSLFDGALGNDVAGRFQAELYQRLEDRKVLDFVIWLEQTALSHLPHFLSYGNIVALEKVAE
jgi:ubiquinone/menaquinone biosynthesis C-methylase UbiE